MPRALVTIFLIGLLAADEMTARVDQAKIDKVVIVKSERTMTLLAQGKVLRSYRVALGGVPVGAKEQQGDHKTPEGNYVLDRRNPKSKFYKSIHVSYPNEHDRRNAEKKGVSPGGDIMIHGLQNGFGYVAAGHRAVDWTDGCIAVTDSEMDEIWKLVDNGTPIEIKP